MTARPNFEEIGCYHQFRVESEKWMSEAEQEKAVIKVAAKMWENHSDYWLKRHTEAEQEIKELREAIDLYISKASGDEPLEILIKALN